MGKRNSKQAKQRKAKRGQHNKQKSLSKISNVSTKKTTTSADQGIWDQSCVMPVPNLLTNLWQRVQKVSRSALPPAAVRSIKNIFKMFVPLLLMLGISRFFGISLRQFETNNDDIESDTQSSVQQSDQDSGGSQIPKAESCNNEPDEGEIRDESELHRCGA